MIACDHFTLEETGVVDASGGDGASANVIQIAGNGGGGSGGALFVQATQIDILGGTVDTRGGASPTSNGTPGGAGAHGRIRLEGENVPLSGVLQPQPVITKFAATQRYSSATSTPLALEQGDWVAVQRRVVSHSLTPDTLPNSAQRHLLWGGWQRHGVTGEASLFTGFTADPTQLPPCDFLQFQVIFASPTLPPRAARIDRLEFTTD